MTMSRDPHSSCNNLPASIWDSTASDHVTHELADFARLVIGEVTVVFCRYNQFKENAEWDTFGELRLPSDSSVIYKPPGINKRGGEVTLDQHVSQLSLRRRVVVESWSACPFDLSKARVLDLRDTLEAAGCSPDTAREYLTMFTGRLELFRMAGTLTGVTPESNVEINALLQDVCTMIRPFATEGGGPAMGNPGHASALTLPHSSPSKLPLHQVQPSPSEVQVSTILSPVSPAMPPLQPTRVHYLSVLGHVPLTLLLCPTTGAISGCVEQHQVGRSPNIVEVVRPPSNTSRPVMCNMCLQKKVKCEQEPGQLASTPCVQCKTCGVACVWSKKVGCHKRAPRTPAASTVTTSIAAESSRDASHFNLARDMDDPILNLIMGGQKVASVVGMVAKRDDWIQDIYLKSLECTIYNAAAEPLAKASADAMEEDEVVELAGDGSKDEEGDDEE
ncbi:hypothetical protein EI94DRAFT_1705697 [Lactarius quietus]|nr:hypothetical protein EI94DRAFT_1705697 [Lactarius quietus]